MRSVSGIVADMMVRSSCWTHRRHGRQGSARTLQDAREHEEAAPADPYSRALVNSEYLLKFAAENGTQIAASVQADIIAGQAAGGAGATNEIKAKFYSAYAVLAARLGSVTADTIKACRSPGTRRALKLDEKRGTFWAVVTVIISVLLFTAQQNDQQLTDDINRANDLAITLRGMIFPILPAESPPEKMRDAYVNHDPCDALTLPPLSDEFRVRSQLDLDRIQNFAIAIRDARSRASRLNWFILKAECDPFEDCWWGQRGDKVTSNETLRRNRFELNPTISNYTAEFLCKVQTWQDVRDYAVNIQKTYAAIFGGLVAHALPILYALLGAYAYRLRQFSETVRNRTYHPSFADSARLITAIIAGAVAGLFNPVRDLSVSPLATAFLVGYGVEIFFRFLDVLLNSFSAGPGGVRPPASLPGAQGQEAPTGGAAEAAIRPQLPSPHPA